MANYAEDLAAALKNQTEIIKKQAILEIIQIVAVCDTYEDFKRTMYGKALDFMREFEADGTLTPGTVDKIIADKKEGSTK
jgi:hypothetical protein